MTLAEAYRAGWNACMNGEEIRGGFMFAQAHANGDKEIAHAWTTGALDAMEAESGEECDPAFAGFE